MAGEYATSLRKTPVVATPVKAVAPKVVPKQAAPVVEKPKTVTPPKVTAPVTAPITPPVAPPAAVRAQAAEAKVEQRAPVASTQAPPVASPSVVSRVGTFLADYAKAAMSPLTEMAVIPAAEGITQGVVAKSGYDGKVTMSPEAKNKLNPFVDPETGRVDRTSQALTGASIVAGAAAGAAVGQYVLPAATRAVSSRVSRMADIPDPIAKFQGPVGKTLSDDEMLANAAKVYEGPQPYQAPYVKPTTSTGTKVKATLAAGLAANPAANAGARAVIQDVGVVPRSVVGRVTREFGASPKTGGTQFASQRAQLGANAAARRTATARATRADLRDSASRLTGSAAGASIAGYAASSIPDSSIAVINNNAAANAIRKATQPSTADRIAQTRAEDIAPVINTVKNPFNNSVTGSTSTSNVSNPNPPEGPPTKYSPPIPLDNFKGGVGQQDVLLKKVF